MANPVEISHDAFGRFSIYREKNENRPLPSCLNCDTGKGRFHYYSVDDANSRPHFSVNKRFFCCISCWQEYSN